MMHAAMLPAWLRIVWIVASCVVAAVHLPHLLVMRGQHRYWHVGHVLMAAGMAYMYLPHSAQLIPNQGGMALFATAAAGAIVAAVVFRIRDGFLNPLWILITAEMAVMVYMFLPMNAHSPLLSSLLAVYLAGIGIAWALGWWDRHYLSERRPAAVQTMSVSARPTAPALRGSLVTMAGAMAYMLVAM